MRTIEIEAWALRVLEALEKGSPLEDTTVELKSSWIPPEKAARRIAAHANAARGNTILWLIGVDEKHGVLGVEARELSNWFSAVQSMFDGIAPGLKDLNVPYKGKTVVALCFDTARAPYVVRNPAFGKTAGEGVEWEVPWRDATRIRSANRSELLLLLAPLIKLPKIEFLNGKIEWVQNANKQTHFDSFSIELQLYVTPLCEGLIVFPTHKCALQILGLGHQNQIEIETILFEPVSGKRDATYDNIRDMLFRHRNRTAPSVTVNARDENIEVTNAEILIRGPGRIKLRGYLHQEALQLQNCVDLEAEIKLTEATTETTVVQRFPFSKSHQAASTSVWLPKERN